MTAVRVHEDLHARARGATRPGRRHQLQPRPRSSCDRSPLALRRAGRQAQMDYGAYDIDTVTAPIGCRLLRLPSILGDAAGQRTSSFGSDRGRHCGCE